MSRRPGGEIILYPRSEGAPAIEVRLDGDTVWLTQDQMADLFGKAKSTINEHIKNVFDEGELVPEQVMRKFGISEFSTKPTNLYNLDVIISVGYRVKSQQGTQFRIWATHPPRVIAGSTRNPGAIHHPRHPIPPRVIPPRVIAGLTRNPGAIHHPRHPITPRVIPPRVIAGSTRNPGPIHHPRHPIPPRVIPLRVIAGLTRNPGPIHHPHHPIPPRVIPPRVIPPRVIPPRVIPPRVIAGLTRNPGALPS